MSFTSGTGILTPEEFDVVQRVYSEISSEDWFTKSVDRREQFGAAVLDIYRSGVTNQHDLKLRCRSLALERFGNGGVVT